MKKFAAFTTLLLLVSATAIQAQMYDTQYTGPVNVYGQPSYEVVPRNPNVPAQQQGFQGVFPTMGQAAYGLGNYFWSYMPAPLRNDPAPNVVPPGQGQVQTYFVPGTR